jgi:thiol-disulfide isomerase/thioredoxin
MKKFVMLFMLFCSSSIVFSQNLHIGGSFKNMKNVKEVLVMNAYTQKFIAAGPVIGLDSFSIDCNVDKAEYLYVGTDIKNVVLIIASPGEKIYLSADINDMTRPRIQGSVLTAEMYEMMDKADYFKAKNDSVYAAAEVEAKRVQEARDQWFRDRFKSTKPDLACLVFLDMLDQVKDSVLFRDMVEALQKEFPENPFVQDYVKELRKMQSNFDSGSIPPDINLPGTDGKPIALSSLKGKIVIIDFWASWCKPCIEEIPNLKQLYDDYNKKGLEIYSVSLDRDKQAWTDAIAKYKLNWIQVSDLKMWDCQAAVDWGIESIPALFIMDKNGMLVQKNLRGERLTEAIKALMEQ